MHKKLKNFIQYKNLVIPIREKSDSVEHLCDDVYKK